jgi:predicted nucleic acid-binding protein
MTALVDTNVLLRMAEPGHVQHRMAMDSTVALGRQGYDLYSVPQTVYEFWVVCTRPLTVNGLGRSAAEAEAEVQRVTGAFPVLGDGLRVYRRWLRLVTTTPVLGKKAHDARLVAAMRVHGIDTILTFNDADFRRFPGITVLTPAGIVGTP